MENHVMEVKGYNGQISVDDTWLTISRKGALGLLTQGLKGDKRIPIANILSVQFKPANAMVNGYIQFSTASGENSSGMLSGVSDENSVIFTKKHLADFEKLRDHLENLIATRINNLGNSSAAQPLDIADQIGKLADLVSKGLLTEEEFAKASRSVIPRSIIRSNNSLLVLPCLRLLNVL